MQVKKISTIAYMLVMVFYGVFTLILSIFAFTKFSDTSQYYDNIVTNLQQIPIVDVQSKSTQNCDSDYSSLFNWNWEGMFNGCDCTKTTDWKIQKKMYRGLCTGNMIIHACVNASGIKAQPFNFFEGTANTQMNVCIKRGSSQYAYYKVADQQKGVQCVGRKLCGNLAYPKSVFCVALTDPCPVYDIQVSSTKADSRFIGYQVANLPNGNYLYYDNLGTTATKEPLSEFRLTQGEGVCQFVNTQKNKPSGQQDYVLSKSNRTSCSTYDPTFVQNGFSIPENRYYILNMNPTDYTTLTKYPGIQIPSSTSQFYTFQRNYLSWNITNRNLMKDFVEASSSLNDLYKAQLVVMIINIFVCLIVSIILNVLELLGLLGKDVSCINGQAKIKKIKMALSYGAKILQTPFLLWVFILSAQKKSIISEVANAAPMDSTFNSQISSFSTSLEDSVYKNNLISLIVLGLIILLDILLFLISKCCSKNSPDTYAESEKFNFSENQKPENQNQFPMQQQPQHSNIQMQNVQPSVNQGYPVPLPVTYQPSYIQQQPIQQQPVYAQPMQQQQQYVQPVQYNQPAKQVIFVQPDQQGQNYY
ncbi:transmembrane protein, putative (macronuclear) [Tetrahymena thermophila SB210]|uniref:Transmembrane protein, putative n=1 Tax=Tetrahymena thermophila (strain SB210) TaxID=312017 RepID=Q245R0_TETTS|nr:transmembrane protein, putative [Tetrahymena thermophila SB210]EAS03573.2 transmembrane protein, putative [Tetrahymena thermophila SB210]|eukprot:XP_001023818.2 transmembrane protein, putative [Tetrahymena thermophila SB210]